MTIVVLGRHGQLARSLAQAAAERGIADIAFLGRAEVDLSVCGAVGAAIRSLRPDLVINAAAYTAVDAAETDEAAAMRINADAAAEAAVAAAEIDARFIQLSTDYVFDGRLDRPYLEGDRPAPLNAYGRSKLAGELHVRASGAHHLIVRTSWVISPFGRNFVRTMLRLAGERPEIAVVDDQCGCPTSAADLADTILDLAERWEGKPATYHVAGSGAASWAELATAVMDESRVAGGPSAEIRPIGSDQYPTPAPRPADTRLDCSEVAADFGVRLPPWRESLGSVVRSSLELAH